MTMPNGWCCPWCHVLCEVCGAPFEKNGTGGVIKHRHRSAIYEQYRQWDGNGSIPNEDRTHRGTMDKPVCVLCSHEMTFETCGSASAEGGPLCHADDHSCYHQWTVYNRRPLRDLLKTPEGRERAIAEGLVSEHINSDSTKFKPKSLTEIELEELGYTETSPGVWDPIHENDSQIGNDDARN